MIWLCACNGYLRLTSGATPTDFITARMASEPFGPRVCTQTFTENFSHPHVCDTKG